MSGRDSQPTGLASNPVTDALMGTAAALAAAISLLERTPAARKSAPSDTMFRMMLDDYRKALEAARSVLKSPAETPCEHPLSKLVVHGDQLDCHCGAMGLLLHAELPVKTSTEHVHEDTSWDKP